MQPVRLFRTILSYDRSLHRSLHHKSLRSLIRLRRTSNAYYTSIRTYGASSSPSYSVIRPRSLSTPHAPFLSAQKSSNFITASSSITSKLSLSSVPSLLSSHCRRAFSTSSSAYMPAINPSQLQPKRSAARRIMILFGKSICLASIAIYASHLIYQWTPIDVCYHSLLWYARLVGSNDLLKYANDDFLTVTMRTELSGNPMMDTVTLHELAFKEIYALHATLDEIRKRHQTLRRSHEYLVEIIDMYENKIASFENDNTNEYQQAIADRDVLQVYKEEIDKYAQSDLSVSDWFTSVFPYMFVVIEQSRTIKREMNKHNTHSSSSSSQSSSSSSSSSPASTELDFSTMFDAMFGFFNQIQSLRTTFENVTPPMQQLQDDLINFYIQRIFIYPENHAPTNQFQREVLDLPVQLHRFERQHRLPTEELSVQIRNDIFENQVPPIVNDNQLQATIQGHRIMSFALFDNQFDRINELVPPGEDYEDY